MLSWWRHLKMLFCLGNPVLISRNLSSKEYFCYQQKTEGITSFICTAHHRTPKDMVDINAYDVKIQMHIYHMMLKMSHLMQSDFIEILDKLNTKKKSSSTSACSVEVLHCLLEASRFYTNENLLSSPTFRIPLWTVFLVTHTFHFLTLLLTF